MAREMSSTTFHAQLSVSAEAARVNPHLYFGIQSLNDKGMELLSALLCAFERSRSVERADPPVETGDCVCQALAGHVSPIGAAALEITRGVLRESGSGIPPGGTACQAESALGILAASWPPNTSLPRLAEPRWTTRFLRSGSSGQSPKPAAA